MKKDKKKNNNDIGEYNKQIVHILIYLLFPRQTENV